MKGAFTELFLLVRDRGECFGWILGDCRGVCCVEKLARRTQDQEEICEERSRWEVRQIRNFETNLK